MKSKSLTLTGVSRSKRLAWLISAGTMLFASHAHADLIINFDRLSDSQAEISGTGEIDVGSLNPLLFLGVSSIGNFSNADNTVGNFKIGGGGIRNSLTFVRGNTHNLEVDFGFGGLGAGDEVFGSSIITLDVETWEPLGSTGNIRFRNGPVVGTWQMGPISVPEPGSTALFLLGTGVLGLARLFQRTP
jgi:hypothetical protein